MTPEERAEQLVTSEAGIEAINDLDSFKLESLITDAIRAAVQEEREACAQIALRRLQKATADKESITYDDGSIRPMRIGEHLAAGDILSAITNRGRGAA